MAPAARGLFEQRLHMLEFGRLGGAVLHAQDHQPERVVADQHGDVDRNRRKAPPRIRGRRSPGNPATGRSAPGSAPGPRPCRAGPAPPRTPQWPMTSVVTPWRTLLSAWGMRARVKSEWVLMSMKPGATTRPLASIMRAPAAVMSPPMAAMRPSLNATSARRPGAPVPSMTSPPWMRMSSAIADGLGNREPFLRPVSGWRRAGGAATPARGSGAPRWRGGWRRGWPARWRSGRVRRPPWRRRAPRVPGPR